MTRTTTSKYCDLEEQSCRFARDARAFVKSLNYTLADLEDAEQLIRSSGSIGANHIEAHEALGKKNFRPARHNLPRRGKGESLLAAVDRDKRLGQSGNGADPTDARGAGVDELFRRHRAQKRVLTVFGAWFFPDLFRISRFDIRV